MISAGSNGRSTGVYKRKVDYSVLIEQLLDPYGVHKVGEDVYRSCCPIHMGDNPTAFSVFANGYFHCFKCGVSGDVARLIMAVRKITLQAARDYIGSSPTPYNATFRSLPPTWSEAKKKPEYPLLREGILGPYRGYCPSYLINRGFSQSVLSKYEIGYDTQHARIVFPVRDVTGKLVGLTYRLDFDDPKRPKYWHDNFSKSNHLYGFHLWAGKKIETLCLVEGHLDVVRLYQLDQPSSAVMGDEISDEQIALLKRYCKGDLVLAFDNDAPGRNALRESIPKLIRHGFRHLKVLDYPGKDPGDLRGMGGVSTRPYFQMPLQRRVIEYSNYCS